MTSFEKRIMEMFITSKELPEFVEYSISLEDAINSYHTNGEISQSMAKHQHRSIDFYTRLFTTRLFATRKNIYINYDYIDSTFYINILDNIDRKYNFISNHADLQILLSLDISKQFKRMIIDNLDLFLTD